MNRRQFVALAASVYFTSVAAGEGKNGKSGLRDVSWLATVQRLPTKTESLPTLSSVLAPDASLPEWLKHPRYREVSQRLSPEVRRQNEELLGVLDSIPLRTHSRGRNGR